MTIFLIQQQQNSCCWIPVGKRWEINAMRVVIINDQTSAMTKCERNAQLIQRCNGGGGGGGGGVWTCRRGRKEHWTNAPTAANGRCSGPRKERIFDSHLPILVVPTRFCLFFFFFRLFVSFRARALVGSFVRTHRAWLNRHLDMAKKRLSSSIIIQTVYFNKKTTESCSKVRDDCRLNEPFNHCGY